MEPQTTIEVIREFGSFGAILIGAGYMFYVTIRKIAPAFTQLTTAIQENTAYLKMKNGSLEKHMQRQDRFMEKILNKIEK